MPATKLKNLGNLFRSASKFKTATATATSAEDVALKKYVSSINVSTSDTIRKQLLNYKAPKSDVSSSSSIDTASFLKPLGGIGGIGNLKLLSAADNDESARLLSEEISAILRGERDYYVDGSYDSASDSEESFSNVLHDPWISRSAENNISLRRKEISRERKQKWIFSSSQKNRFDRLTTMCGEKLGPDATIQILGKLGRGTGLKEFNALIRLCIETARKTDDEEVSLQQIFKAYKIFEWMKELGFPIGETTYGPFLRYLIDFGLVPEFHFFCELIRDENSLPTLTYYEMLLYIGVNDEEKIQELCYNLALYDGNDKSSFQQSYLLAFCESNRKKELLPLLEAFDITKVSSMEHLVNIFRSLGKLSLDLFAERFLLALKMDEIGAEKISNFIYNYVTSIPNLAVEDVLVKFKTLLAKLELMPLSEHYEKFIQYCCELLKVHDALNIVDEMLKVGFTLSLDTFHSLLDACEESREYNLVRRLYSMISCHDLKPSTETFRRMINLSVKMKDFEGAYGMIVDLDKLNLMPTSNIYNAIMAGYFRYKNINGALMVLKQMKDADVKPDSQTYSYLLVNCDSEEDIDKIVEEMKQSGVLITKIVFMSLINAYVSCGQFEKAKQVMLDKRIPAKSLNEVKSVFVSALASHGQMSDALNLYEEIKQAEGRLEPKAVISLIEHLQSEGQLDRLLQLLKELDNPDYWFDGCFRVVLYCIRHEHLTSAVDLLRQLKQSVISDDAATENVFDEVFCQIAEKEPTDMHFGLAMLQAVKDLDLRPSRKSLDFLLTACVSAKDLESCFLIWKEYKAAGLPYNVLSFVRMYQALLALGDHKSAQSILNKIPRDDPHVSRVIQECQATFTGSLPSKGKKKKKKKKKNVKV
ncbi:pentatricopeptide repeat-containing protein At4g04790, mitochondrial-like isoform X2 [Coffea arabica]|uniref:Pentatricopeptide repeat-containing protein At4g04790, mitochondrial-like isoform X2 n=1 Tax=Coffea arabica TaxID=13443 RepID=A0A6P6SCR0_COFAR